MIRCRTFVIDTAQGWSCASSICVRERGILEVKVLCICVQGGKDAGLWRHAGLWIWKHARMTGARQQTLECEGDCAGLLEILAYTGLLSNGG